MKVVSLRLGTDLHAPGGREQSHNEYLLRVDWWALQGSCVATTAGDGDTRNEWPAEGGELWGTVGSWSWGC